MAAGGRLPRDRPAAAQLGSARGRRKWRLWHAGALMSAAFACCPAVGAPAVPVSPGASLARGLAEDLAGHQTAAFQNYERAAAAGLAQAQLNVAVMYDSGRGVAPDAAKAALYYALAASNGEKRAAYDLGQLYASGEGVPRNLGMANAWFSRAAALGSGAGIAHAEPQPPAPSAAPGALPRAPRLLYPGADAEMLTRGHVSFVWEAPPQPASTVYFIEIHPLASDGGPSDQEPSTALSALSVKLADGAYAWRVFAVCPAAGHYAAAAWQRFKVGSEE